MTTQAAPVWNPYVAQAMASMPSRFNAHLDALAQSSSSLRNLQLLSKVPTLPTPNGSPAVVPLANDDSLRFGTRVTRVRKSALPAGALDRFSGEVYPFRAPYIPAVVGQDTRWLQRGSEITPVR